MIAGVIVALATMAAGAGQAATYTVTTTADARTGSLRWAIEQANARVGRDTIVFDAALAGRTIRPASTLPTIDDAGTRIMGDIDDDGVPDITLNGSRVEGSYRLGLAVNADDCILDGLCFQEWSSGVWAFYCAGLTVRSCHFGTNLAGTAARENGVGVRLIGVDDSQIGGTTPAGRNVFGGTQAAWIEGGSSRNRIIGNYVGLKRDGIGVLGGTPHGIAIMDSDDRIGESNAIGGTSAEERNVFGGVWSCVDARYTRDLRIQGNYFGLAADGDTLRTVESFGIELEDVQGALIGGATEGARNVFAGGAPNGVVIDGAASTGNTVRGNYFGLNAAGTAVRRLQTGVLVRRSAGAQTIGGSLPAQGNHFCADGSEASDPERGVFFHGGAGGGSLVRNNYFGVRPDGRNAKLMKVGVKVGPALVNILDNTIARCANGIQASGVGSNPKVLRNEIRNCGTGVVLINDARCRLGNAATALGEGQNLLHTTNTWHVINLTDNGVPAEGNDWGTTVEAAIHLKIVDQRDDARLGAVDIDPLMGGASPTGGTVAVTSLTSTPTAAGAQIVFSLSAPAQVHAQVLNLAGRPVGTVLHARECGAGTNTLLWAARSDQGLPVPNGVYVVEVTAKTEDGSQARALGQVTIRRH